MAINQYNRVIAVLPSLDAIGEAIDQLVFSGFPLGQIFLVGQDQAVTVAGELRPVRTVVIKELLHQANLDTVTGSSANLRRGVVVGNVTGGVAGLLLGLGLLVIPGVGELVLSALMAYLLSTIGVGTLTGGAVGAMVGQGITDRVARSYMDQIRQGNYLLVITGSDVEIFRAEHILYVRGIQPQNWG